MLPFHEARRRSRERWAQYGQPVRLDADAPDGVYVFGHASREGAEASAAANRDEYGHPCTVEERDGQWVTVVDLRPRISAIAEQSAKESV